MKQVWMLHGKKVCTSQQGRMYCMSTSMSTVQTCSVWPTIGSYSHWQARQTQDCDDWWLGFCDIYSKKKILLLATFPGEKNTDQSESLTCVDWWFLCHLLLSLWADSICDVQSEPEVSSQSLSLSLSIVDLNIHSAAVSTLRITLFSLSFFQSDHKLNFCPSRIEDTPLQFFGH